jgi:acetyl-CoA carboxylase biotin carboxyl carrier protein
MAMSHKDADLDRIKELIDIMKANELLELEIKHGDDKIFLKRDRLGPDVPLASVGGSVSPATAGANAVEAPAAGAGPQPAGTPGHEDSVAIKSPIVGTFYATPSPDSEPFVEVGDHVEPNMVVCIIEAMKVMNEIRSEASGTIVEILVKNGQAVEYGQVLFNVKPDH